jgi:hypothetical protein
VRTSFLATWLSLGSGCWSDPSGFDIDPATGRARGGDTVRLEGRGFLGHGPPVVYFGSQAALAVVIESDRLITVKTPEAEQGAEVEVRLEFPDGDVRTASRAYAFARADVIEIAPRAGD